MGAGGQACPKPERPLILERHQRKLSRRQQLEAVILAAKKRDGHHCRWPHCEYSAVAQPLDGAHVFAAKGMGGDPTLLRSERKHVMALCRLHHRAQEKHILDVEALTADLADDKCAFWRNDRMRYLVAQERAVGILERD